MLLNVTTTVIFLLSSLFVILLVFLLIKNIIFYRSVKKLSIAEKILKLTETAIGADLPVRVRAWDGSETGPKSAPLLHLKSKSIVRWIIWSPRFPSLGFIRALVDGNDLDIDFKVDDFFQNFQLPLPDLILVECSFPKYIKVVLTSFKMALTVLSIFGWSLLCLPPPIPPEEFKQKSTFKKHTSDADKETASFAYNMNYRLFELMLGQTMVYSCAYYETPDMSLEEAQLAKFDIACRKLGLKEGMTVLDIGCGWGSFLIHAAQKYGVRGKGVTVSSEQCKYAQEKVKRLGLEKMVDVQLMDFRDLNEIGHYDTIASFEMMEHIGIKNHRCFLQIVEKLLKPGGRFVLQTISRGYKYAKYDKSYTTSYHDHPVFSQYFFPSSEIEYGHAHNKSLDEVGLEVRTVENLREHYVTTCKHWAKNLEENEKEILNSGISPGFFKCFKLGVAGCGLEWRNGLVTSIQYLCVKEN